MSASTRLSSQVATRVLRNMNDKPSTYDPVTKTLQVDVAPGCRESIHFPLQLGTFEHIAPDMLDEVAIFLNAYVNSPNTYQRYTRELERFLLFLKIGNHNEICQLVLAQYLQNLVEPIDDLRAQNLVPFSGLRAETADQYFKVIRSFIKHLHASGHLPINLTHNIENLVEEAAPTVEGKFFTDFQWSAALATLENLPEETRSQRNYKERFRFTFLFGYALGLTTTEQQKHDQGHITRKGEKWVIKITGRGNSYRNIVLNGHDSLAWDTLVRYRTYLKLPPEPNGEAIPLLPRTKPVIVVTKGPRRGVSINSKSISKSRWEMNFKSFLRNDVMHYLYGTNDEECERRYNSEWVHLVPHSLRHTRLVHLASSGKDLLWLQKFAGHRNTQYTSIYYPSMGDLDFDVWDR